MEFMTSIAIKKLQPPVKYGDKLLLIGSCFTEHIGNALQELKFSVLQNPHGILFDPASVCNSIVSYINNKQYTAEDLFQLNEVWNSWAHHSRFSNIKAEDALTQINHAQHEAHTFLKEADWMIITLGSSFSYRLTTNANEKKSSADLSSAGIAWDGVANCHRAPAQWFDKHLLEISETTAMLTNCYQQLKAFNPGLKIIFTISPVRHLRDGVVDNNRSKARLLESVHQLIQSYDQLYYFPAYELVIDVLRDYRFYDTDLAHPNYMATEFVMQQFRENCIQEDSQKLMEEIKKIVIARRHKAFQPSTTAHRQFLAAHLEKTKLLQQRYPFLRLEEELAYFAAD